MGLALRLARRGLGRVWPNPAVGCVIAANGTIIGRGWTQPGGRPHAEAEALARAGAAARGATAYVSLEPCAHHGRTPPCAEALVEAGIRRVLIGARDPDPRVDGGGIAMLEEAGLQVEVGILAEQARSVNAGFLSRIERGRPLVAVKMATTLDGRVATAEGESQWITGEAARRHGHLLRARHDGILVGIGTVLSDDPELTCRLAGLEDRSPVRIVLDPSARLPIDSRLVRSIAFTPLWVLVDTDRAEEANVNSLATAGIKILPVAAAANGMFSPATVLDALGEHGLTRILIEGGPTTSTAFLNAGLVDCLYWYRAARLIGADGRAAIEPLGFRDLDSAPEFESLGGRPLGEDWLETYRPRD